MDADRKRVFAWPAILLKVLGHRPPRRDGLGSKTIGSFEALIVVEWPHTAPFTPFPPLLLHPSPSSLRSAGPAYART